MKKQKEISVFQCSNCVLWQKHIDESDSGICKLLSEPQNIDHEHKVFRITTVPYFKREEIETYLIHTDSDFGCIKHMSDYCETRKGLEYIK